MARLGPGEREVGTQPRRGAANCVTLLNRLSLETRHTSSANSHLPSRHCRRLQPDGSGSGGGSSSSRNGGSGGLRGGLCSSPKPCGRSQVPPASKRLEASAQAPRAEALFPSLPAEARVTGRVGQRAHWEARSFQ